MELQAIRQMLNEFLSALGFEAMAREVLTETEWNRLQHYARVVLKNSERKEDIRARFAVLRLV